MVLASVLKSVPLYLDPGTGSLIAQLLAGGALTIGVLIWGFWKQIKSKFTRDGKNNSNETTPPDNQL